MLTDGSLPFSAPPTTGRLIPAGHPLAPSSAYSSPEGAETQDGGHGEGQRRARSGQWVTWALREALPL